MENQVRAQAPQELIAQNPELFAALFDASPEGVILFDAQYRILYANKRARSISRIEPEYILSSTLWELYPGAIGTLVEATYRRVQETRIGASLPDFYYEPFDHWVRVHAKPVGEGFAVFYSDVSKEHRLAMAKSESERRLSLAMEVNNGVGIWEWDIQHDLVYADKRFAAIYGVDEHEAEQGTSIANFTRNIHPDDVTSTTELIQQAIASNNSFYAEYRIRQADGSDVWIAARGQVIRNELGEPLRFPGVSVDITERRKTEAALMQAEKLAAVGRLASSIAHEINNPLEAVTNLVFLASQQAILPEVQGFLDLADQELRRVSVIVNQTLRFHKQSTAPTDCQPEDLFRSTLPLYEGRLRNASISVDVRVRSTRNVSCFEGDIRQVLSNLIGNAIDAMPQGGRLLLGVRNATEWATGRRGLALVVADTGSGMPPEVQKHIFDAFFTTKGHSGTGLGLWISSEIMRRHGGTLGLRSSTSPQHHGTVFTLFLPLPS
ncbi:MAG: ATP-binding protein [Acidobacteriaceae bacterium]|nr:ATP-binding protein [Acidobacteriaceae bacterium]